MANEEDVDMELELSVDIGFSSASSKTSKHNSPISPLPFSKSSTNDADNSSGSQSRNEREEGEIDSDVSSSPHGSQVQVTKIADEELFSQKVHKEYAGQSESSDGDYDSPKLTEPADSKLKERDYEDTVDIGQDVSEDSSDSDNRQGYREVKALSSSGEDMSSEDEVNRFGGEAKDSDEGPRMSPNSESSESVDQESESEGSLEIEDEKHSDIVNISDEESSASDDSDGGHSERNSDRSSVVESKDADAEMQKDDSDSESETKEKSNKDANLKSSQFKKTKQSRESSKSLTKKKKHSDEEGESLVDHLQIAAPQQALLLDAKKKSLKDKTRGGSRSSSKEDRERNRKRDKRDDGRDRQRERSDLSDDRHNKKHRKHKEKYDKKADKEPERLKSTVAKKRTHSIMEEDLRQRLLEKRSTRDDVVSKHKEPREHRETHRKQDKYPKSEKVERRKEETTVKLRKEERERVEESSIKKSKSEKDSKDVKAKENKKDKEKSTKINNNEKSKKRLREKTKSAAKKEKSKSESESEDKQGIEMKKPLAKRPRSAEQTADVDDKDINTSGKKLDSDKESPKGYNYDDISSISSEELTPPPSPIELKKPTYYPAIMGCRDVKDFQWLNKIEEGTYGVVYRARDNRTDEVVALKRLKMEKEKEGFPITSLREINTLLKAQHPNIVTVREIVVGSNMDKIYIVMDYVEHDLKALMETMTQPFLVGEVKTLMIQLLRGVQHMHDNWILHRDIKASNLLLSHKGILKIGDFGLAREYGSPLKHYTSIVVTLWYRAPELLLGAKEYKTAIDLWSVGCVFAELMTMKPLFPGKSEIDLINRIFKELGTPNDAIWPGPPAYSEYPMVKKTSFANHPFNKLRQKFGATLTDIGFNLLNRLLTYDPSKRITAEEALKHEFFEESPLPVDPSMFPTWPAKSELGHRVARKHNASPKAPEGGAAASKLANEDNNLGFHMPTATKGFSAKGAGFNLKF